MEQQIDLGKGKVEIDRLEAEMAVVTSRMLQDPLNWHVETEITGKPRVRQREEAVHISVEATKCRTKPPEPSAISFMDDDQYHDAFQILSAVSMSSMNQEDEFRENTFVIADSLDPAESDLTDTDFSSLFLSTDKDPPQQSHTHILVDSL